MNETAVRERCENAPPPEYWQHVPLDLALSGLAVIVAGALVFLGVMP